MGHYLDRPISHDLTMSNKHLSIFLILTFETLACCELRCIHVTYRNALCKCKYTTYKLNCKLFNVILHVNSNFKATKRTKVL